jgi:membrane-bound lytic murein transglycosylase D
MNKIQFFSLVIFFNSLILPAHASEYFFNKDTVKNDTGSPFIKTEIFHFSNTLDSLFELWYIKNSDALKQLKTSAIITDSSVIPDFPDSVYIERIKSLNSAIDLPYNPVVKSYIEVYTKQKRDKCQVMLGLTDHYFPLFEKALDENGLPLELKYLPVIESALNPIAISRAGAIGLWQFIYSTGKLYGLEITSFVDERCDPVKATYAAITYLKDLFTIYGDWTLVIAAYNCGPGNVNKAIKRCGGKNNYWDIYYKLPKETRGYVPAFIAAAYVTNYFSEHNLVPLKVELPLNTDTVTVNEELHLEQVAGVLKLPVQDIKNLNPQYKREIIPAGTKKYSLVLPYKYISKFIDLEDSILTYKDSLYFSPEARLRSPVKGNSKYDKIKPANSSKIYYTVKSGDNIGYISGWYDVNISDIKHWNNIKGNRIKEGQKLLIYVPKNKAPVYEKVNSMTFYEKQKSNWKKELSANAGNSSNVQEAEGEYIIYTVKSGDTLWDIARQYPGISDHDIKVLNNISDENNISPGQKLKIKKINN